MLKKTLINFTIFALIVLAFFIYPREAKSQSKIVIKEVKIHPQPNYSSLKGGASPQKLIDGKVAGGSLFWLDRNALGWQNYGELRIDLELPFIASITEIKLNTVKNEAAEIQLPLNVIAFASVDGEAFSYIGDLNTNRQDHPEGSLKVELVQQNIGRNAKFIRLIIIPHGKMFFTDEISVYGKKAPGNASNRTKGLSELEIKEIINKNKRSEINRSSLLQELKALKNQMKPDAYMKTREAILRTVSFESNETYNQLSQRIAKLGKPTNTEAGFHVRFFKSAWGDLQAVMPHTLQQLTIHNALNTTEYIAFEAVNNTDETIRNLKINAPAQLHTTLYELKGVRTRNSTTVADAMVPVTGDWSLQPAHQKKFVLAIESRKVGVSEVRIQFSAPASQATTIRVNSVDIGLDDRFQMGNKLNVNVWPYFTFPFYKNKEQTIQQDLRDHYSNTFAIPAWTLEPLNLNTDFQKLKDYLRNYQKGDKVILFMNHRPYMNNPGDYLKDSWKKRFLLWYDAMMSVLKKHGVDERLVYLYPFDEIQERELQSFNTFASWVKKERGAKIFITLVHQKMLPQVIKNSDIYQMLITKNDINRIRGVQNKSFWIYDIMDNSKQTDPYLRYRLLAWRAFVAGAEGIGFWNYGEMFGDSVWDDFDGKKADYNAVYDDGNEIRPSRRWEAFKQGIEDHMILKRYAARFDEVKARKIAEEVLKASNQAHKADEARAEILRVLAN